MSTFNIFVSIKGIYLVQSSSRDLLARDKKIHVKITHLSEPQSVSEENVRQSARNKSLSILI